MTNEYNITMYTTYILLLYVFEQPTEVTLWRENERKREIERDKVREIERERKNERESEREREMITSDFGKSLGERATICLSFIWS